MSTCTISITVIKYDCVLHYQNIHSLRVPNNEVSSTPHPTPRPRVHPLLQIFGGWRLYSWVFLNEYTSIKKITTSLTQFVWLMGPQDGGGVIDTVNHVSEEGFPNRTTAAYITCMTHLFLLGWKGSRLTQAQILEPWCVLSSVH